MSYKELRDSNGCYKEWRDDCGKFHRDFDPAEIHFNSNGVPIWEVFWCHGKTHRDFGPAAIGRYSDGSIRMEQFWFDGNIHRELGPACIMYNRDGSISKESFNIHGKRLGDDREGFWALWEKLTKEQRQDNRILKCLARYS